MTELIATSALTPANQLNLRPIVTSHSIDGTFESCPRKFEFMHVWQQYPEGGTSGFAAEVGTALHEAVQAWARIALFPGRDRKAVNAIAVEVGLMELLKWWPWALEVVSLKEGKPGVKQRSLGEGILLYESIITHPFWEGWELVDIGGFGLSIEVPYRINHVSLGTFPVPNPNGSDGFGYLVTQGKIDFILRNTRSGEIRVFDLKTTVKDPRAHKAAFMWSGQGPGYAMILEAALQSDWKRRGFSVSYLVSNFAAADGSEPAMVRVHTYDYEPEQVMDAIDTKYERLMRMKSYAEREWWPRRSHGCDAFGQPCPYMGICGRRDRQYIKMWFLFEGFEESTRIYEPIWELNA